MSSLCSTVIGTVTTTCLHLICLQPCTAQLLTFMLWRELLYIGLYTAIASSEQASLVAGKPQTIERKPRANHNSAADDR